MRVHMLIEKVGIYGSSSFILIVKEFAGYIFWSLPLKSEKFFPISFTFSTLPTTATSFAYSKVYSYV